MSVSDAIRAKAERLLGSGRVEVTCSEDGLSATVEGDHDRYVLVREPDRWRCPCPARGKCSHVEAVERIARVTP